VHSIHFKGRQKPWMRVLPACTRVTKGAMRTTAGRVRLDRGEGVAWAGGACRLQRQQQSPARRLAQRREVEAGEEEAKVEGEQLAWQVARQLAATYDEAAETPPSKRLGGGKVAGGGKRPPKPNCEAGKGALNVTCVQITMKQVLSQAAALEASKALPMLEAQVVAVLPAMSNAPPAGATGPRDAKPAMSAAISAATARTLAWDHAPRTPQPEMSFSRFASSKPRRVIPRREAPVAASADVVTWSDGERVGVRCCGTVTALKAEWYRVAHSVQGWNLLDEAIPKPISPMQG